MDFSGKIAVVTGASRGIGREIAEELRKAGADVFGTATSDKGAAGISEYLGEGRGLVLNVADQASVDAFAGKVKEVGDPDILVNNAGITRDGLLMRMKDSDWDDVINTNLSSVYRMSKAFLRGMMKKRYGRIVSVSSVVGLMGNAGQTNYAAAKAGIIGFTRSLAKEVASRGITVNAVAPGFIATDMTAALTDEQKQKISAEIPSGRLGSAADIANAVLFLASDASSYITGDVINVNGGMYMA